MAEPNFKKQAQLLKLLANPVRLEILAALSGKMVCVNNLSELVSRRQPNISQHLGIMRHAGLIDYQRKGKRICYFIVNEKIEDIIKTLERRML